MIEKIGLFKMANAMAAHAAERQGHISRNIANADTPGYRSTDMGDFAETLANQQNGMRMTRPGHLAGSTSESGAAIVERPGEPSPNGNTVSLEVETMQAATVRQQHDMALSIYSAGRDVIRASLGRR